MEFDHLRRYINQLKYHIEEGAQDEEDLMARLAYVHDAVLIAKAGLEATLRFNDSLFHHNFRHGEVYNLGFPGIYCYPQVFYLIFL